MNKPSDLQVECFMFGGTCKLQTQCASVVVVLLLFFFISVADHPAGINSLLHICRELTGLQNSY